MAEERSDLEVLPDEPVNAETSGDEGVDTETAHLREQIEETRSQMGETIDAIQDRLSFANLSEQVSEQVTNAVETAKGAVYDATIGKAADMMNELGKTNAIKTVRDHPIPFILIGVGAGLLAYQTMSGRRRIPGETRDERVHGPASGALDGARDRLSSAGEKVTSLAGNAYESVSGKLETAYTSANDVAQRAYGAVGSLGTSAREHYDHQLDENPLALGAVALALGAAVGMAIPSTRYEGELLGPARQQFMDKAQTTASQLLDKTKDVVAEAGRSVGEQVTSLAEH